MSSTVQVEGRRERTKREKRSRILAAARAEFLEKGYENATTREIAKRAGIGKGTLFLYAEDKRELFLMIVNDQLDVITANAFMNVPKQGALIRQLTAFFQPRYEFWAIAPDFSRTALQLIGGSYLAETTGDELARGIARRAHSASHIVRILRRHAGAGIATETLIDAAKIIFSIYVAHLREWLNESSPTVEDATTEFQRLMKFALVGIEPIFARSDCCTRQGK